MNGHPSDALSAYLDGDLDAAPRADVERHLAGCAACRDVIEDLRQLRAEARRHVDDAAVPGRELWAGIAARIAAAPAAPQGARILPWYRRKYSVGLVELAAAAVLVAAVTAGVMWRPATSPADADDAIAPVVAQVEPMGAPESVVTTVSFADAQFDAAVADLERVLDSQRDSLNPRTVLVLERNLRIIDDAIREAREALAADPANALLNAHLASARQRKLDLLRRAASITEGD